MQERSMEWWLWTVTAAMLTVGLIADRAGLTAAIILTALQIPLVAVLRGGITSFPAQVRIGYLALLLIGLWNPLAFVHWIQFVGTWANVLVGYCFLARCVSLLPWNRREPLTKQKVIRTIFSVPVEGSIL